MDNGFEITMTRTGDRTWSWRTQGKLLRLFLAVMGLALLILLASLAIWAIVVSALVIAALIITATVCAPVRRWLNRRRGRVRPF